MNMIKSEDIEFDPKGYLFICRKLNRKNMTLEFYSRLNEVEGLSVNVTDEGLILSFRATDTKLEEVRDLLVKLIMKTKKELTIIYDHQKYLMNQSAASGAKFFIDKILEDFIESKPYFDRYDMFIINNGKEKLRLLDVDKRVLETISYSDLKISQIGS